MPTSSFAPPADYKILQRPPTTGSANTPTSVFVNLDIHQLYGINAMEGTASIEARLELKWNDTRLYGGVRAGPATPVDPSLLWVPKMVFSNQENKPETVASLMTVNDQGMVVYRRRMKVRR